MTVARSIDHQKSRRPCAHGRQRGCEGEE